MLDRLALAARDVVAKSDKVAVEDALTGLALNF
jgi:hypothetical protein